jgi:preprotein translocase subunit SecD
MSPDKKIKKPKQVKRLIVKGYLRPDSTYYVSVPKEIKQALDLRGGEYFVIKVDLEEKKFSARLIDFSD